MLTAVEYSIIQNKPPFYDPDDADQIEEDTDLPSICPRCHHSIGPILLSAFTFDTDSGMPYAAVCFCTHCRGVFLAEYASPSEEPLDVSPLIPIEESFDQTISRFSPNFGKIYNQALTAESMELDEVSGIAYRKALEYLVKDYLIWKAPDFEQKIREASLSASIQNYMEDEDMKALASCANWMGNEFVHYNRRYDNYDLDEMKRFIHALLGLIQMQVTISDAKNKKPHRSDEP